MGNDVNAFSYFSIIAKHWLIMENNKHYKHITRNESLDFIAGQENDHYDFDVPSSLQVNDDEYEFKNSALVNFIIKFLDERMNSIFRKKAEISIASAIAELLRNNDRVDVFHRKAILLYTREMTGHKTNTITKVVNKLKPYVQKITDLYYANGHVDFDEILFSMPHATIGRPKRGPKNSYKFIRTCPACKHEHYYGTRAALNTSIRHKSKCMSCSAKPE